MRDPLTEKQRRFIDFYIAGANATQAAVRAGYSEKSAAAIGSQNLAKLKNFIVRRNAVLENERIAGMDEINRFWTSVMRDTEVKPSERLKASELRAKAQGAFIDAAARPDAGVSGVIADIEEFLGEKG